MAKISLTLTDGGNTVLIEDTDIVKFQANSSTGSLVYIYNLKAQPQVLDVSEDPSTVAGKSPLFISLTQVLSVFPTASVTLTTSSGTFLGGEPVSFASGAANGQIDITNGSTSMTVLQMTGQTLANGMSIRGLLSDAIGVVSGTPTYTPLSTQAFYLNSGRIIEYQDAGFDGVRFIQVNNGFSPNGEQIFVSESVAAISTAAASGAYVTLGGAQTVTGNKTLSGANTFSGTTTFSGLILETGVQAISGAGVIDITNKRTDITTTGANAYTLANGTVGQTKTIVMVVDGGDATITPTTFLGHTTITLNAVGDSVVLQYGTGGWAVIGGHSYALA
jgi:hypothetical protein